MIQKTGTVTITEDKIIVSGFEFVGPILEADCAAEMVAWAIAQLEKSQAPVILPSNSKA